MVAAGTDGSSDQSTRMPCVPDEPILLFRDTVCTLDVDTAGVTSTGTEDSPLPILLTANMRNFASTPFWIQESVGQPG